MSWMISCKIQVVCVSVMLVCLSISYLRTPASGSDFTMVVENSSITHYYTPDHYVTFNEVNSTLHKIAVDHPDIAKVISIGKTWGWNATSGKYDTKRDLWTIKISDNVQLNDSSQPRIYFHWHHAREWIDPAMMMYVIDSLITGYTTNDTIRWLINHYEIYITPLSNADGYVTDGNGGTTHNNLRKNCRDLNNDSKFTSGEGVDLERNWDWNWTQGDASAAAEDYRGPSPFSEPETIAESNFMKNYNVSAECVFHSYAGTILIPWFDHSANCPHNTLFRDFASHMAMRTKIGGSASSHYAYGRPDETIGYSAPGGTCDWLYGNYNKLAIAIEMEGSTFYPATTLISQYVNDLYNAVIYYMQISNTNLVPKSQASSQPNAYVVWGYVKDGSNNPMANATVMITNTANSDSVSAVTDYHGYYEINLGALSKTYLSTTSFSISSVGTTHNFSPTSTDGSQRIDLIPGTVPEMQFDLSIMLLMFPVIAQGVLIRRKRN